ncbi:methyltransferase family protein [Streptomyces indicus]|uniref:Protein-S-isoprenylcysteine O-methyltransferase Ste14 n=1 Tax=Streptomyces indicus TaxID=417292 RepID=A0A1G9J727_9ACTN|nr:isoprenylcysteine carboxylmethyltransferase family protein [Streptomyces indicus]SDL33367.1 Protein-S-isoprenylcysteine O-methyltransferase Ste14 [Streptomyces indicus]
MAAWALVLFGVFLLLDGGVRIAVQQRRTGESGVRRPAGVFHWCARLASALGGLAAGVAAPAGALAGLGPLPGLDRPALRVAGVVLAAVSIAAVFACQLAMGASWRTTVDPAERPALVTSGPFSLVRNPIYTALTAMTAGLALAVPNAISVAGLAAMAIGNELQVRRIEEPYLKRIHGDAWQEYAARTGRFVPGLGRLRRTAASS